MKLGIIGVGNMAGAITESIITNGVFAAGEIVLFDLEPAKLSSYAERGLIVVGTPVELVGLCDIILLAVKPQQVDAALSDIAGLTDGKCIVSILAGISSVYLKDKLGEKTHVVRVMPNTPILLGCGSTAISINSSVPTHLFEKAVSLFSCAGEVAFVDEDKINAVTGVNGSSPAYFFVMAEAMVKAAVEQGIDDQAALKLAAKAMEGAALMLQKTGKTPAELTAQVTSPGGTTLAALAEMKRLGFSEAIRSGMLACTKRAFEIGK